jgi:hypothetical protein
MKHILNNLSEEEKNSIREQHTGGMKVMTENFNKLLNSKLGDAKPLVNEEQTLPFLNVFPNVNVLKSVNDTIMTISPNSNVIYLTKRNPKSGVIIPKTKFAFKVSGSYGWLNFDVKLRNFKRNTDGSLELEAQPTNSMVSGIMKKMVPAKNLTNDGWLKVYIPVAKINPALDQLFTNKGSEATIDAGNGIEISLENA